MPEGGTSNEEGPIASKRVVQQSCVFTARGRRAILDSDLAKLYGVPTKRLNERVRRNPHRFPADFAFLLSSTEWEAVRAVIAASSGGGAPYRTVPALCVHRARRPHGGRPAQHAARDRGIDLHRSSVGDMGGRLKERSCR